MSDFITKCRTNEISCYCCPFDGDYCGFDKQSYQQGRADAIEPIMKGYKELVELENLLTRYFCEVDLRADKTDLEKFALKISSDGMQTIGWLVGELEQIKEQKNEEN